MLPVVQFDPSSLTIFYDAELISNNNPNVERAVNAVAGIDVEAFKKAINDIDDKETRGHALQVSSAFIHEKRHFLDFISTNYGAFRFRQFFEIYWNLPAIFHFGAQSNELSLPLDIYLDPILRRVHNLKQPSEEVLAVAGALKQRRSMIEKDRMEYSSRFGNFQIGGEAQLETLAYLTQIRFVTKHLGEDGVRLFYESLYDRDRFSEKYASALEIGRLAGIVPAIMGEDDTAIADTALLECVMFASLQTDHISDNNGFSEGKIKTSYASERFAALATWFRQNQPDICNCNPGEINLPECWQAVNDACLETFGLSVLDQIERDIEWSEEFANRLEGQVSNHLDIVYKDFIRMRRKSFEILNSNPYLIFSTEITALTNVKVAEPLYVVCSSSGQLGEVPDGHSLLMGYEAPPEETEKILPIHKWWWACARNTLNPLRQSEEVIGPNSETEWFKIIDQAAPTAKLIMNGRRIRTMLGPELMFAEQRLKALFNINLKFMPAFEFPDIEIPIEVLSFYRKQDYFICDMSSRKLNLNECEVVAPWTLRQHPKLGKALIDHMGGHEGAYYHFVRDWSPWVIAKDQHRKLFNTFV